jgi:DNA-binding IclR family transcriptional regulator
MKPTIRERGQKVFQIVKEKSVTGVAAIAAATGIAKSSVHRHQQAIERRNQYPKSGHWSVNNGHHRQQKH